MRKFLSYILILILLVGTLTPRAVIQAQVGGDPCTTTDNKPGIWTGQAGNLQCTPAGPIILGTCVTEYTLKAAPKTKRVGIVPKVRSMGCVTGSTGETTLETYVVVSFTPTTTETSIEPGGVSLKTESIIEKNLDTCAGIFSWTFYGCVEHIIYVIFYSVPSFLLWTAALFFNSLIAISLSSKLLNAADFVSNAWVVVRDLSNIFFILILIYVAIEMILGLGHGVKKIIAQVVVMALLINFSMFFTKVVIDSANVLALVFYNKLTVETTTNGKKTPYEVSTTASSEHDISGAMVKAFDPTKLLTQEFFDKAKINYIPGIGSSAEALPVSMVISMLVLTGIIMIFAAYSFFVTGFYFLARMIELWILIIFSPFAFMSSTLPALSHVTYLGWSAWLKRLIDAAFMAPIFMFFMYFIFLLIQSEIFNGFVGDNGSVFQTILLILIPAIMILVLLNQATKFAKKGSGQLGEAVMGAAKLAGGLAIGGTALGLAGLGRGTIGTFMKGASTGDTYAQRKADGEKLGMFGSTMANLQENSGWSDWQKKVGKKLAASEHKTEHASHARHDLDTAAGVVAHGKKWNDLNGEQRKTVKTNMARADAMRNLGFGNKTWAQLKDPEQKRVNKELSTNGTYAKKVDQKVVDARQKQGLGGIMAQSAVTGSYDIRNIANMVIREQSKGWAKVAMGMTAAVALGLRGGLKNINSGTAQGSVIKDFSNTISEALKNMNVSVDLSHVAAEKKGDDHGHGGGGHH